MKIKTKGKYVYEDLEWHQNQSSLIIPKSAVKFLTENISIEDTIRNHKDKFDFMLRTKVPRSSRLVLVDEFGAEIPLQNICRYYVSENGGDLIKIMPPLKEYKTVKKYVDNEGKEYYASTKTEENKYKKYKYVGEVEQKQKDRRMGINIGWKVTPCNNIKDFKHDINYDFYIEEAKKLVEFENETL